MHTTLLPAALPDEALLREAARLVRVDREATAAMVRVLMEVDARRLYLREGCSSLFVWCVQVLRLEEGAAYNRIEVARVARRIPAALEALQRGWVSLTAVRLLAPHLTAANHREVLARARGLRKRDVQRLVAELAPRPAVPTTIRPVSYSAADRVAVDGGTSQSAPSSTKPSSAAPVISAAPCAPDVFATDRAGVGTPEAHSAANADIGGACAESSSAGRTSGRHEALAVTLAATGAPPAAGGALAPPIVALSPTHYKLQMTVTEETHAKLRLAQDLLRHTVPDGDLAEVVDRALTVLIRHLERQRFAATATPRPHRASSSTSRYIPAFVRRAVWQRDAGQCAFVGRQGRCRERAWLEFHHTTPYAAGGLATVDNISLRCRAHNAFEASLFAGADPGARGNGSAALDHGSNSGSSPPA